VPLDLVEPIAHDKAPLEAVKLVKKSEAPLVLDATRKKGGKFHLKGFHQRNMIIWTEIYIMKREKKQTSLRVMMRK
jgi:hypothetical protein